MKPPAVPGPSTTPPTWRVLTNYRLEFHLASSDAVDLLPARPDIGRLHVHDMSTTIWWIWHKLQTLYQSCLVQASGNSPFKMPTNVGEPLGMGMPDDDLEDENTATPPDKAAAGSSQGREHSLRI